MTHAPAISGASGAPSIDPANHPQPSTFDRPAHNVSGSAGSDRGPPIRDYFQNAGRVFSESRGMNVVFRNARAFANPSPATLRRHALGVVRGDEPDCSGKRNLLTALIGLQRAADRRGNRGSRFRALVLQGAACGPERHRGLEGLFDPASTGNVEIEVVRLKHN